MTNLTRQFSALAARYEGMPMDAVMAAYSRAAGNPWLQNQRVRQIQSLPAEYSKDAVAEAIKYPGGHEQMLRQTHRALEAAAYPMYKMRKVYTDILTYRYYTAPAYIDSGDGLAAVRGPVPALLRAVQRYAAAPAGCGVRQQAGLVGGFGGFQRAGRSSGEPGDLHSKRQVGLLGDPPPGEGLDL